MEEKTFLTRFDGAGVRLMLARNGKVAIKLSH